MEKGYKVPADTRIGHVHLKVADLQRAMDFYCGHLGFELITMYGTDAAFISAGGYHHHIGMNTWHSLNGEGHIQGMSGLENFTITIPDRTSFDTIESIINRHASSEQQPKQMTDKNQFMIFDPDSIQIVFKSE